MSKNFFSFQDYIDQFDPNTEDKEIGRQRREAARSLVLNPTLTWVLTKMEADILKKMAEAPTQEELWELRHRLDVTKDFRRNMLGLAQDAMLERSKK